MDPCRVLAPIVVAAVAACTTPATGVLIALDTDVPPDRVLTIRATVSSGAMAGGGRSHTWVRGGPGGDLTLPATFGVAPGAGPDDAVVLLVVEADVAAGGAGEPALSFRRRAQFAFTPHQTTRVPIFLALSCGAAAPGCATVPAAQCTVSTRCEELGETCGDRGGCVSVTVLPGAGDGGGVDAAVPDAAVPDAAVPDAADAAPFVAPAGHIETLGPGLVRADGRVVLDDGVGSGERLCAGPRCVTGGIVP